MFRTLRPTASASSASAIGSTLCSGASSAFGPMISRACAVCSGVVLYGCAPAVRSSGQPQHSRPERGEHTLIGRHTVFV